ncbi:MAG: triose-phosphate isomerase [Candidatus Binatia bacterium]
MSPPLVVGNWKMHGTQTECAALARKIAQALRNKPARAAVVLGPPYTSIPKVARAIRGSKLLIAGQNSHWEEHGAFTGEISPAMLRDAGCDFVILGHSERRHIFKEDDEAVGRRMLAALRSNLRPILCVGETLAERRSSLTTRVICRQLRIALKGVAKSGIEQIEIAYEPVWAIGTGQNATPEQITKVHERIRRFLVDSFGKSEGSGIRILYGGSVKPENAGELAKIEEVNGLLVGGASLKAETFLPIVRCF